MAISKPNGNAVETPKPVVFSTQTNVDEIRSFNTDDRKSRRILRQGVYQSTLQSPGVAGLSFTTPDEYIKLVEFVAEKIIHLVQE